MVTPKASIESASVTQNHAVSFANNLTRRIPLRIKREEITGPSHGLNQRTLRAELVANPADMHIDGAIGRRGFPLVEPY